MVNSTNKGQLFKLFAVVVISLFAGNSAWALESVDGVYQIGTAQDLKDFATLVNGGTTGAKAELTGNIILNENVLDENGNLNNGDFDSWTPIGTSSNSYTGTFTGNGYSISGLYFNNNRTDYVGLFGYISGATIDGIKLSDGYIYGRNNVGGICGYNRAGTITNCSNGASVTGTKNVGGISGYNETVLSVVAKVSNDYNTGSVTGSDYVGGICGYNDKSFVGSIFKSCKSEVSACFNTGTVTSSGSHKGSVCGYTEGSTSNNYYLSSETDGNGGMTADQFASGEVAYLLQNANDNNNWGQADGDDLPSLAGPNTTVTKITQYTNCMQETSYSSSEVDADGHSWGEWQAEVEATCTSKSYHQRICKFDASHIQTDSLSDANGHAWGDWVTTKEATCSEAGSRTRTCANDANHSETETIEVNAENHAWGDWVTTKEATCSETGSRTRTCANDANHSETETIEVNAENHAWGDWETVAAAACNQKGLKVRTCANDATHKDSVSTDALTHDFDADGFCRNGGCYQTAEAVDGVYQIANAGNLYWFATLVNSGTANASAVLTNSITVNADMTETSSLRSWLPIGTATHPYAGTFNGQGYAVSGLYFDNDQADTVGFFGAVNGSVKNVMVNDSYFNANNYVGGVCGYNAGTLANTVVSGTVNGAEKAGGLCGYNAGNLLTSYSVASVNGSANLCGQNAGTAANCYYQAAKSCGNAAKTAAQFKSGEVAILLQMGVDESGDDDLLTWGQVEDTDVMPAMGGTSIDYTRDLSANDWGTLCMPYSFTATNVSFYTAEQIDGDWLVLKSATTVEAGQPVIYYCTEDNLKINIPAYGTVASIDNSGMLKGEYAVDSVRADNTYYLKGDKFYARNGYFVVNPFKAYIKTASVPVAAGAPRALNFRFGSDETTTSVENIVSSAEEAHIVAIYNVKGQRVSNMEKDGIYMVKMSDGSTKKVVIR